jgi:hypothetical protein
MKELPSGGSFSVGPPHLPVGSPQEPTCIQSAMGTISPDFGDMKQDELYFKIALNFER